MSRSIRFDRRVRTATRLSVGIGAVTVVALAPAVGSASTVPTDRVVLTATMEGGEGRPRAQVIERFAEEVERASDGGLTIEITYGNDDSYEQFQAGEFDLLLANARSVDSMGVSTFDALTLPFLVNDDDQADRVASSPVVDDMMAGLSAIGATGLIFAPVYEEHLAVAGTDPLRTMDQLDTGLRVFSPSTRLDSILDSIGATPLHGLGGDDWVAAIDSGEATTAEFPTALATVVPQPSAMAANFALFYEFAIVMIGDDALAGLDADQTTILQSAAEVAAQRSIDERIREDDAFRDACAQGATLTAMPYTLMGDIGRALDDVVLDALDDPQTKDMYDALKRFAGARTWTWPSECHEGEVTEYEPPAPPSTTFPEGVYRIPGRSREQLLVSGVSNDFASNSANEYVEVTIVDGTVSLEIVPIGDAAVDTCSVSYSVDEQGRLVVAEGCLIENTYTWWETADGIALEAGPVTTLAQLEHNFDLSSGLQLVRVR